MVERRGITPLGPTVRLPLVGSYLDDDADAEAEADAVLAEAVRGFAGLALAARWANHKLR